MTEVSAESSDILIIMYLKHSEYQSTRNNNRIMFSWAHDSMYSCIKTSTRFSEVKRIVSNLLSSSNAYLVLLAYNDNSRCHLNTNDLFVYRRNIEFGDLSDPKGPATEGNAKYKLRSQDTSVL